MTERMTPRADRLIHRVSTAASFVLAVALGASLASVTWPRVASALGIEPRTSGPAYNTGERIDVPADWYRGTAHTLVVFARASCGACEKAQPFLKELVASLEGRSAVVLAGGAETRDEDARFARSLGVADRSIQIAPTGLRVRATPTLVLTDRQGTILEAWEGVGPPEQQAAIAKAVERALNR